MLVCCESPDSLYHIFKQLHGVHDVLVLLTGLNELFNGHYTVSVFIHFLEELVHVFRGRFISHTGVGVPPHHVVDRLHNRQHLLFGDVAVLVDVVQVEGPVELLGDRTSEQHRQADDKVLKADRAVSVDVEGVEQKVGVRGCISLGKELRIDGLECLLIHHSTGTLVLKASIEGLELLPGELGLGLQLVQALRLVTHRRQLQVTVAAVIFRRREEEEGGIRC